MTLWSRTIMVFVLVMPQFVSAADWRDPVETRPLYDQAFHKAFGADFDVRERPDVLIARAKDYLKTKNLSEDERYLLTRAIAYWLFLTDVNEQKKVCRQMTIRPDDYVSQSQCEYLSDKSYAEKKVRLEAIFKEALAKETTTAAATSTGFYLLELYAQRNDLSAARQVYKKALQSCPKSARREIAMLKSSIAGIYASPSNAVEILDQALQLYTEVAEGARLQGDMERFQVFSYNRGVLRLFAYGDYENAIKDFGQIMKNNYVWIDAQVFLAFSWAKFGKKEESLKALRALETANYTDDKRLAFLKCYLDLTKFELGRGSSLQSCVNLAPDTQGDVVFHITKTMADMELDPAVEVKLWRQFWAFYKSSLAPRMQDQASDTVDAIELEMTKAEVQIKELELKNFQLVKTLFILAIVALLVNVLFFLRLRSRNQKIEKLQDYLHKSVLSRFLPPLIVEEIIQGRSRIESKPKMESITVLFADMVDFTTLSGTLGPEGISVVLNRFMEMMTEVIYRHQGTIDKFIGDAVMVIFGAPLALPEKEQAERAVACARDMLKGMAHLNEEFKREFGITIEVRIGINQGPAIVGTFGNEKRSDYTAVGPAVNLASRIENRAHPNEIMISPDVARHLAAEALEERGVFKLKGITTETMLYAVKGPMLSESCA